MAREIRPLPFPVKDPEGSLKFAAYVSCITCGRVIDHLKSRTREDTGIVGALMVVDGLALREHRDTGCKGEGAQIGPWREVV